MDEDVYFKKEVTLQHAGKTLRFRVSQDLFSSYKVDTGTRFLLRTVVLKSHSFQKILDLGCGYGPIGLTLKKLNSSSEVHMVDRDALAVEYTRQNAALNGLDDIRIYGSLGYDDVQDTDFHLVIANIPGKAGEIVIAHFLKDAAYYLKPGGMVAVVVVALLESMVQEILENTPDVDILFHENRSGHAVFHYRFGGGGGVYQNAFERGIYGRGGGYFSFHNINYHMQTACGLPEFDSLNYKTRLLLEGLENVDKSAVNSAVVFHPGQGHVPVFLWKIIGPQKMILIDRDLLSLRYSQKNLALNGYPDEKIDMLHQVDINANTREKTDLIIGMLREEEGTGAASLLLRQASEQLSSRGVVLVAGSSTAIARLVGTVRAVRLRVKGRIKKRGYSLLVQEKR